MTSIREDYDEALRRELAKNTFLRHLFAKLNKEVEVVFENGEHIRGILKTIDRSGIIINFEIELLEPRGMIIYANWKNVVYMKTKQTVDDKS